MGSILLLLERSVLWSQGLMSVILNCCVLETGRPRGACADSVWSGDGWGKTEFGARKQAKGCHKRRVFVFTDGMGNHAVSPWT